jgi:hypothetical protein
MYIYICIYIYYIYVYIYIYLHTYIWFCRSNFLYDEHTDKLNLIDFGAAQVLSVSELNPNRKP